MLLSGRILNGTVDVNTYEYANQAAFTEGDQLYVYFQLIDTTKDDLIVFKNLTGTPTGRRYMPAAGSTLIVTINNVDSAKTLLKSASQPFALDGSIWRIQLVSTDSLRGTFTMQLQLNEPGPVITRGRIDNALDANPISASFI